MAKDERLLPVSPGGDLQIQGQDTPPAYAPPYDEDPFSEQRSFREYLNVIYKRLWWILTLVLLSTIATAIYMARQPTVYETQTTLLIEPRKPKAQSKESININFGNDQFYWNTQLKLIQNTDLMRDAITKLGLHRDPALANEKEEKGFFDSLLSVFSRPAAVPQKTDPAPVLAEINTEQTGETAPPLSPQEKAKADSIVDSFMGGISVERQENTNLVSVRLRHTNKELIPKVANSLAKSFIDQDVQREMQGAQKTYDDLTKSVDELKTKISQDEAERISFMRESGLPLRDKGEDLKSGRLQTLSGQLLNAELERKKLENEYNAAVKRGNIFDSPRVQDSQAVQEARARQRSSQAELDRRKTELDKDIQLIDNKIADAESRLSKLLVKYTEEYPEVIQTRKEIESLNKSRAEKQKGFDAKISRETQKLNNEGDTEARKRANEVIAGLRSQLEAATRQVRQLEQDYSSEYSSANQQGQSETRLLTLNREIETSRSLLDTLTQRLKEKELELNSSRPDNISISQKAESAYGVGPQRSRAIGIAFLISLAIGVGLAFLLDYLDDSVKSSDDISRYVGLPTLAMIPHYKSIDKRIRGKLLEAKSGEGGSLALATLEDNRSVLAESYRHLRTSLLFSSAGKPPQIILVTSSQPSEGKTTTAINTAVTLAQSGADVVVVDCDLRRPRLHHHFNMENSNGLTNYLSGDRAEDSIVKSYPKLSKLKVITSGPIPPNPAELLSSNEMRTLLQHLRTRYQHIIVDSPPAISFTDAAILSTLVDGVVIVAMAGKSSLHLIRRFKQRLANIGARIYGVVLNGIKPNSLEYGYYGYGQYNYYYANQDDDRTPRMEDEAVVEEVINRPRS
jgi:capsular exopolysaccharide synthesis family protein